VSIAKNIYVIALRETKSYITSPMFYIVLGVFLLMSGFYFYTFLIDFDVYCKQVASQQIPLKISTLDLNVFVIRRHILNLAFISIFFLPIFTMRLLSEEKKNKTIELLMTSPIRSFEIIAGKYLSICLLWLFVCVVITIYPLLMMNLPEVSIDWPTYFATLGGFYLYSMLIMAIGLLASALTENQLVAAIIGFAISALLYFMYNLYQITESLIGRVFYDFSSISHFLDFYKGVIDTSNIVYYLTAAFFVLFVTERVLESQRWR
jgi:ABC-2 type transport system permease protein